MQISDPEQFTLFVDRYELEPEPANDDTHSTDEDYRMIDDTFNESIEELERA